MFRKKGDLETFDLADIMPEGHNVKVTIQHVGPVLIRELGFRFQEISIEHGVSVPEMEGKTPTTLSEVRAVAEFEKLFHDVCKKTVTKLEVNGEVFEGESAHEMVWNWAIAPQVGNRALQFQHLTGPEVLSSGS